jgi:hypothetical protein
VIGEGPARTLVAPSPAGSFTLTGFVLHGPTESHFRGPVKVPTPSSPNRLSPEASTAPVEVSATLWSEPAALAVTFSPLAALALLFEWPANRMLSAACCP